MSPGRSVWFRVAAAAVVCLAFAGRAEAQVGHPLYDCADQFVRHTREYVENVTHDLAACELNRLKGIGSGDCLDDSTFLAKLANNNQELDRKIRASAPTGDPVDDVCWGFFPGTDEKDEGKALCPLESRNVDLFLARIMGGTCVDSPPEEGVPPKTCTNDKLRACASDADCLPGTLRGKSVALVQDLFRTQYDGCARPSGTQSNAVHDCAQEAAILGEEQGGQANQCFFSCEKANLASSDACVDEDDGDPAAADVIDCVAEKTGVDQDLGPIVNECSNAEVVTLGCPLGAHTAVELAETLGARLADEAQQINLDMFHSSCRTQLPGVVIPVVPADVTLEPSLTKKQISCGQVLDNEFFGNDRKVSFDTDLNCVNADTAVNGIVIARNGITVNGRAKTRSISGPGRRSLRTGAGILIAPGVRRTTIAGFRRIQNFGVGVQDSGDNQGIQVLRSTFFRNIDAGVRSSSRRTRIGEVTLDRNGLGLDLSGDASIVTKTTVMRSEPQSKDAVTPLSSGYGILLGGTDVDENGRTVRVTQSTIEGNVIGIVVDGSGHRIESNTSGGIRDNIGYDNIPRDGIPDVPGDGILVRGSGNRIQTNSIKRNLGNGITILGDNNSLEADRTEENGGYGFEIHGTGNILKNNNAGAPNNDPGIPGPGNLLAGYMIGGTGGSLDSNRAEGNHGGGFILEGPTALFKGNRAEGNDGVGFDIGSTGNVVNSNQAAENGGSEYVIEAGNTDPQTNSNKANGHSFTFPEAGDTIE